MKHIHIISICLSFVFIINTGLSQFALGSNKALLTVPYSISQCSECKVCAKKVEQQAYEKLQQKQLKEAKKLYLKANELYREALKNNPENTCTRNGYIRTKTNLKQLERY